MAKYDNFIEKVYNLNRTIVQWLERLMGHFLKINLFWGRYNSDRNAERVPSYSEDLLVCHFLTYINKLH